MLVKEFTHLEGFSKLEFGKLVLFHGKSSFILEKFTLDAKYNYHPCYFEQNLHFELWK